jgi:hypothetical protein
MNADEIAKRTQKNLAPHDDAEGLQRRRQGFLNISLLPFRHSLNPVANQKITGVTSP